MMQKFSGIVGEYGPELLFLHTQQSTQQVNAASPAVALLLQLLLAAQTGLATHVGSPASALAALLRTKRSGCSLNGLNTSAARLVTGWLTCARCMWQQAPL
jgi:DMSO reductase anchor subunit